MTALRANTNSYAPGDTRTPLPKSELARIAAAMDMDAGIHITEEKTSLIHSRLIKRLRALNLSSFKEYCDLVESPSGKEERENMLMSLTTNLTRFFREAHHFEHLIQEALPPLVERAKRGERIRIWSAGCSNGQEPYSIAAILLSLLPNANNYNIKILASDIDREMVLQGRKGEYSQALMEKMPQKLRSKYFDPFEGPTGKMYRANTAMRNLVAFRELNLNMPRWPMKGKFEIIFCRNVVIYFNEETKVKLWQQFASYLVDPGYIYLGHSERLTGPAADSFKYITTTTHQLKQYATQAA